MNNKLVFSLFLGCMLSILVGCKKDKSPEPDFTGPDLTEEQINNIPPPTYNQLLRAYELALEFDPTLINNEPALTQAVIKWIKNRPDGELNRQAGVISFINMADRLTAEEWKVAVFNMIKTIRSLNTASDAEQGATAQFPCDANTNDFDNTKINAIQHAYWNALMTRRSDKDFAKKFSTAHESKSPPNADNTKMDLHNNEFGIRFAEQNPKATDEQLLEMLVRQKFVFIESGTDIPANTNALVYIAKKKPYDGTFTGTVTNPDSGGPWDATFDLSQCDNTIKGQMTIIRGQAKQMRRLTGTLANGTISLQVSDPYTFENPEGLSFCRDMAMILSGNENALSGSWRSSNCMLGGMVSLKK